MAQYFSNTFNGAIGGIQFPISVTGYYSNELGCHSGAIFGLIGHLNNVGAGGISLEHLRERYPQLRKRYTYTNELYTDLYAADPSVREELSDLVCMWVHDTYLVGQMVFLMSDRITKPVEIHSYICITDLVKYLVEKRGWGCVGGPVAANKNYFKPPQEGTLVQGFILMNPKHENLVAWDTAFIANKGKSTLGDLAAKFAPNWNFINKASIDTSRIKAVEKDGEFNTYYGLGEKKDTKPQI